MTNKLLELARDKEYQQVLDNIHNYPLTTVTEVADFLRNEDIYNVAMSLYRYLLKKHETSDYYYGMGQCYGKIYQYNLALWYLERAFDLNPNRSGANYYAYILERNSQMFEAKKMYRQALSNGYNQDLWTLSHYAYFLEKYGQKTLAKSYYKKVLSLNPAYTWAIKRYALCLLNEGEIQQSMGLMQTSLQHFPKNLFVKLNYLEYLIIRGLDAEYESYLASLDYEHTPLPFQVLVDLFDYCWRYLIPGKSNLEKTQAFKQKAGQLKDSVHRDFDDLNQILVNNNGNLDEWKGLISLLLL